VTLNTSGTQPGDALEVLFRFDDEPFQSAMDLRSTANDGTIHLNLRREAPYSRLDIRVRLASGKDSASFYNIPTTPFFSGMTVSLSPADQQFDFDIPVVQSEIDDPEQGNGARYRWGKGPESILLFHTPEPEQMVLEMGAFSPIPGQRVEVLLNGITAGELNLPVAGQSGSARLSLQAAAGTNVILLRYARWNHGDHSDPTETFAQHETRSLAVAFTRLRLVTQPQETQAFAYFKE